MTFDLKSARALCEAATPGPWFYLQLLKGTDLEFVKTARTLLPEACDEIERLLAENKRLLAFAGALMEKSIDADWMDLDGGDVCDLLLAHGLRVEVPATEADCAEEWAQEYGVEPGDPIHKLTPLGERALAAAKERPKG